MANFFTTLIDYIQLAWGYFLNVINTILTAFLTLYQSTTFLDSALRWFPAFLGTSTIIVIAIIVIKFIIGR